MGRAPARLQMEIRTPHAAPVTGARARVTAAATEILAEEIADGVYELELPDPGDYLLTVARDGDAGSLDLRPLQAQIRYALEGERLAVTPARPLPGASALGSRIGAAVEIAEQAFRIPVTLDYVWFTPVGYPPTLGNRVDLLVDGEQAWAGVAEALAGAIRSIHLTTWIYQPTAELVRPDPLRDPEERERHTAQRVLEERARAGATVRFLLWDAPVLRLPGQLRRAAAEDGVFFQVLEEPNPTRMPLLGPSWRITNELLGSFPIGSFHQKSVIVDSRVGFCGGMNIKENDWDTREHAVFDPRRCAFTRPAAARALVAGHVARPDYPPRHDFMARVEGPAVAHLEANFRERWNRLLADDAGAGAPRPGAPLPEPSPQPPAGSSQVQVVRTMPEPSRERGIRDVYLRAVSQARRLIYIEDQYFRSTLVSDAIVEALRASPDLEVVVLTAERQANELLAGGWSYTCFSRIRRQAPRFELYTLRSAARDREGRVALQDVDNHAKLLIVDDRFLLVGSCNVNDRGFEYEGELDVAVADADLARRARVDLWREHLGGDPRLSGDIAEDLAIWREHAELNRAYDPQTAADLPTSNVFPFMPRSRRWVLVGPHVV